MTQESGQYSQLVENQGLTYQWLQRDVTHDNSRGMQVEGQELGAFFDAMVPEPASAAIVFIAAALLLPRRRTTFPAM